ncbi:hypothetical protein Zmor_023636 [Zophobas morio]|uniref:Uncharacterized protein n=1 Tax=Zophobas morio TaxID=2755281 RepID=A0AA38M6L5_9CUCU|nr:hypothetical protein Zmor_023636 [Zophobas morio]
MNYFVLVLILFLVYVQCYKEQVRHRYPRKISTFLDDEDEFRKYILKPTTTTRPPISGKSGDSKNGDGSDRKEQNWDLNEVYYSGSGDDSETSPDDSEISRSDKDLFSWNYQPVDEKRKNDEVKKSYKYSFEGKLFFM